MLSTTNVGRIQLIALGILALGVENLKATCHTCSSTTYAACINETAFKVCPDGKTASDRIEVCANNYICTSEKGVCKPRTQANVVPDCGGGACGICSSGFACLSKTQFEYCKGSTRTGIIGKCPTDYYCDLVNLIKNHNICIKSCSSEPTCYAEEVQPGAAPSEPDYSVVCKDTTVPGNYNNIYDSTCATFVYCEAIDEVMNSILYKCGNGTYFSIADKRCIATKPRNCS